MQSCFLYIFIEKPLDKLRKAEYNINIVNFAKLEFSEVEGRDIFEKGVFGRLSAVFNGLFDRSESSARSR